MQLMQRTCNYESMNVERLLARIFVVFGGLFWTFASLGGTTGTSFSELHVSNYVNALLPLAITIAVFVVGLFYEIMAAILLATGAVLIAAYLLITGAEFGVFVTMISLLMAPMVIGAVLYWLAARTQQVCELQVAK
jgi:hypothetical protein